MKPYRSFAAVAGALALAAFAAPALAATALEGAVFQQARAFPGLGQTSEVTALNTWTGTPEDLTARATANALEGSASVMVRSRMNATWDSADAGRVELVEHSYAFDDTADGAFADLSTGEDGPADWSYTFVATEESVFELSFDLLGAGLTDGLGFWDLLFFDGDALPARFGLVNGFDDGGGATGAFTRDLVAGRTYTVALQNRERLVVAGDIDAPISGRETGGFDWRIVAGGAAVPEPAAWALMIGGFGLAGATLRRRRAIVAA